MPQRRRECRESIARRVLQHRAGLSRKGQRRRVGLDAYCKQSQQTVAWSLRSKTRTFTSKKSRLEYFLRSLRSLINVLVQTKVLLRRVDKPCTSEVKLRAACTTRHTTLGGRLCKHRTSPHHKILRVYILLNCQIFQ